ncbi:MAG: hypothetical protein MZV64_19280 [Ignavibacteriales bacterium]|nr:hypothetical protein [Ignavibacteriales bacterium]
MLSGHPRLYHQRSAGAGIDLRPELCDYGRPARGCGYFGRRFDGQDVRGLL